MVSRYHYSTYPPLSIKVISMGMTRRCIKHTIRGFCTGLQNIAACNSHALVVEIDASAAIIVIAH
jgi:hypothetical protein